MCYVMKTNLSMILRKFLFFVEFEPSDFYKKNSYIKNSVYICVVSVPLRNNVFYLYLAVPKKRLHTELLDSMTTPFEIKRSLVQSGNTQKNGFGEIF